MKSIESLRTEIKAFYQTSKELTLSEKFVKHRQFNYYFQINTDTPYLLYLNMGEEGIRFTLKCLEFPDVSTLQMLIANYPHLGSSSFNMGHPIKAVSFLYHFPNTISITEVRGNVAIEAGNTEISIAELLEVIAPN
tara:strand:- start:1002 stop:1409 length:408 start_codon:yes stop_codon:yes gene_type:complete